jgi:uncharacterized C2H2 Zn-finger protein
MTGNSARLESIRRIPRKKEIVSAVYLCFMVSCPKCQHVMKRGAVSSGSKISMWYEAEKMGLPQDLREARDFDFEKDKRKGTVLIAWRCPNCGYVELFSPTEYKPTD